MSVPDCGAIVPAPSVLQLLNAVYHSAKRFITNFIPVIFITQLNGLPYRQRELTVSCYSCERCAVEAPKLSQMFSFI